MSETDEQNATDDATDSGAETGQDATTENDATTEKVFTQSELDSRISKALIAAQKRTDEKIAEQRAQDEKVALLKDGEYKKLYEDTQATLDAMRNESRADKFKAEANGVLVKLGMAHYSEALIPGTKTIDELLQRAEAFKAGIESAAEAEVAKRLDTGTNRVPTNSKPKDQVPLDKLSIDEFKEYKRANGLI